MYSTSKKKKFISAREHRIEIQRHIFQYVSIIMLFYDPWCPDIDALIDY